MNTIKTLVVVTTLLAIGYGAHVVLNKPIPNGQFAGEGDFPTLPGFEKPSLSIDGDGPSVSLPPMQAGNGTASNLGTTPQLPELGTSNGTPGNRFARPTQPISPPANLGDNQLQNLPTDTQGFRSQAVAGQSPQSLSGTVNQFAANAQQAASNLGGQLESTISQQATEAGQAINQGAAQLQDRLTNSANQMISGAQQATSELAQAANGMIQNAQAQLGSGANGGLSLAPPNVSATIEQGRDALNQAANSAVQQVQGAIGGAVQDAVGAAQNAGQQIQQIPATIASGPQGQAMSASLPAMATPAMGGGGNPLPPQSDGRFEEIWFQTQSKLQAGQLVDALLNLSMYYHDATLTPAQRDQLVPLLDQLAGTVVYSNGTHIEAPYTAQAGDTIESVASAFRVAPEFLMRTNGLSSPALQAGQMLKVVRGPFRGELSLSRRELTLFVGRYYAGRFPVAIGRDFPNQATLLEVTDRGAARPYVDPRTGEQIAAGAANNPYGNVWIGLSDSATNAPNLGIHASGTAVEAADTRGCIGMSPEDADDVRAILTIGSRIQIDP